MSNYTERDFYNFMKGFMGAVHEGGGISAAGVRFIQEHLDRVSTRPTTSVAVPESVKELKDMRDREWADQVKKWNPRPNTLIPYTNERYPIYWLEVAPPEVTFNHKPKCY